MDLYLIKTEDGNYYATNGENSTQVMSKFKAVYDNRAIVAIKLIEVRKLVELEDNDDIIFF